MTATPIGVRESTENIPSARRVRDVEDTIAYLDPEADPFTLLSKKANSRSVTNSEFEWMEKEPPTTISQVNGAQTSGDTAIEVTTGTGVFFYKNDVVWNARTNELFSVSSIATDTLTVVRAVGSQAAVAMNTLDDLFIVGSSNPENGPLGVERSVQEAFLKNYTQIFRDPFGESGTQMASNSYGGKGRPRLRRERGVDHMRGIERAFMFGQRNKNTSDTGKPVRYAGGFEYFVTTNIQDFGGTATEPEFETFCQTVFQATGAGSTRVLFAAPGVVSVLDQIAAGRLKTVPSDETYGIAVKEWLTSHGRLLIVKHRELRDGTGGTGRGGYAYAVDPKNLVYAYLNGRNTKLREDVGVAGDDGWTDEYLTECGFEMRLQKVHAIAKAITG